MDGVWWKTTKEAAAAAGHPWPYRAHAIVATMGCDDLTHENGATEAWPGSHWEVDGPPQTNKPRDPEGHQAAIRACAVRRRLHAPPIQLTVPKGSFYLRDERIWHRGVSNRSIRPRHIIQMGYRSAEVRPDVTHGSTILRNRSTDAERAVSKADTHWRDPFERFHPDCAEMLAVPSRWGVDRNCGFLEDVVVPGVDRDLQVDSRGEVVMALPTPMPACVRGMGWAEAQWAAAAGGVTAKL